MSRIAVVGAGIAGLACADLLGRAHEVVLFESDDRLGGHARTLSVPGSPGSRRVDTGFIVYNEVNYPLLTRLFAALGVPTKPSDMSFGVRYGDAELEYCASSLAGIFAQKANLLSPSFLCMLADIRRFFRDARTVLQDDDNPTLAALLERLRPGAWFRDRFLVPMGAAIWSTPPDRMMQFPAKTFVRFFDNHGLLGVGGHHPWRTVDGGSAVYVAKLASSFRGQIRLSAPVTKLNRRGERIEVMTRSGDRDLFDEVVLAGHADASLALIDDATPEERDLLGAFEFRSNEAVLHGDVHLMPRAKAAWASWVYAADGARTGARVSVTYWMNRLQGLDGPPLFVTLNPDRLIAPEAIFDRQVFRHPVFSQGAIDAQARISDIQGKRGLWFCGAWLRNGFHEDGLWSAVEIAKAKGVPIPWL